MRTTLVMRMYIEKSRECLKAFYELVTEKGITMKDFCDRGDCIYVAVSRSAANKKAGEKIWQFADKWGI